MRLLETERLDKTLVCECEAVTAGEVRYAVDELNVHNLVDLRRRTRVGMELAKRNFVLAVLLD
ncbi:sn-glycerol-3-phosphate dehydrogenase subunit A [Actinobacillus equuli]|nr:sn-glycerol-3-phosphate dehydrogenase subunit A [Actinobacillus equuli]